MKSLWKKLFIIVVPVLLVISFIIITSLSYQLDTTIARLDTTKARLDTTETELDDTKTQLNTTEIELDTTKVQLDTTIAQLDTTKARLDTTEAELDDTKTQLNTTVKQLKVVENDRVQMLNSYSDLRKQIYMRLAIEQDAQNYVTPDVPTISEEVQKITGGYSQDVNEYWRDYERLYRWVVKNIDYTVDSYTPIIPENMNGSLKWVQEFWRMPVETLEDKAGDCEDMAVLLASMMLNYNERNFAVWALKIQTHTPEYKGHSAVAFPVKGDKLAILDPAGNYYTGYRSGGLRSDDITKAVSDWLSHWSKEMPDAEICAVFSGEFYRQFSSTDEFIEWVRER